MVGGVLMLFFGRTIDPDSEKPSRLPGFLCTTLVAISFVVAAICAVQARSLPGHRFQQHGMRWFAGAEWGLLLDFLSTVLMLLVAGIGTLVHVYSTAYMSHDGDHYRFFGGLNFFVAMMQILVLANNYLLLFAGWEGVGLASYILIGFYYRRWRAGVAGMKAFIINRTADAGMVLALLFLILRSGSLQFDAVRASSASWTDMNFTLAASLLLVGALGKSAQFPLHIWLPDAMEGPTPVSALIHSATMVCAGVYLVIRSGFIFVHAPEVSTATAIVGAVSALLAATVALVENDIKRVLAYSTISQIGFMFIALGVGAHKAALFHLFTHAFFKSLLFLGSGSIIHALHGEQNLKHMGGLRRRLPGTFKTMGVAALALSAVPGFAGFFSKDAILGETLRLPNGSLLFAAGLVASLLTACYTWRMMFLAFYGEPRVHQEPVVEAPASMGIPMYILAAGCIVAGWFGWLFDSMNWSDWPVMLISSLIAFGGIAFAWYYYVTRPDRRAALDERLSFGVNLLRNRWYIDALYEEQLVEGVILRSAAGATRIDAQIIDATVDGAGWISRQVSNFTRWIDRWLIDGLVRFASAAVASLSSPARAIQTGFLQTYALLFVAGLVVALGYYLTH
jgi:NADH-quinone oxidoreductase subunit L